MENLHRALRVLPVWPLTVAPVVNNPRILRGKIAEHIQQHVWDTVRGQVNPNMQTLIIAEIEQS